MPLGYCAAMVGSLLLIFQDNAAVRSSRVKQSKKKEDFILQKTFFVYVVNIITSWA